jgi:gliding motility-associated protein GldM
MSLPKEPRQKMINMMYLVLTALLALNVSAEILNAFKTVNNSIKNANGVIDTKNKTSFTSFDELIKDEKTKEKALKWQPVALKAKNLSDDLDGYINGLKSELVKISGTVVENGVEEMNPSNLDAASHIFDTQKKGEELYGRLQNFKTQLLGLLDPKNFEDPSIKKTVAEKKAEFEKNFPLDLSIPASQTGSTNKDWSTAYFHMTPSIAAMTILSKFQNDVKSSEAQMVDFCLQQVGTVKLVFDKFQPLIGTNATYLMPGQELEIQLVWELIAVLQGLLFQSAVQIFL